MNESSEKFVGEKVLRVEDSLFYDEIKIGNRIKIRDRSREYIQDYVVKAVGEWEVAELEGCFKKVLEVNYYDEQLEARTNGVLVLFKEVSGKILVQDSEGNEMDDFKHDVEILGDYQKGKPEDRVEPRSPQEMEAMIEENEKHEKSFEITDETGEVLCEVSHDARDGYILEMRPKPYVNVQAEAEHTEEIVYATDDQGNITQERLTRKEVRDQGKRYLLVTTLIFHGNEVLLQTRSEEKTIDPGKISASAHGMAKELLINNQMRISDTDKAATINSALEINEELRYGEGTTPFIIKVWPGTEAELHDYAKHKKIDDPNTVYVIPQALFSSDGYPLGNRDKKRTRAISAGFIFSKDKPEISIDPNESTEVEWKKPSEFVDDPNMTDDMQACVNATTDLILERAQRDGTLGELMAKKAIIEKFYKK